MTWISSFPKTLEPFAQSTDLKAKCNFLEVFDWSYIEQSDLHQNMRNFVNCTFYCDLNFCLSTQFLFSFQRSGRKFSTFMYFYEVTLSDCYFVHICVITFWQIKMKQKLISKWTRACNSRGKLIFMKSNTTRKKIPNFF